MLIPSRRLKMKGQFPISSFLTPGLHHHRAQEVSYLHQSRAEQVQTLQEELETLREEHRLIHEKHRDHSWSAHAEKSQLTQANEGMTKEVAALNKKLEVGMS